MSTPRRRDQTRRRCAHLVETVDTHARALLERPDVVGVGVGTRVRGGIRKDEPCVTVFVREKRPLAELEAWRVVPPTLPSPTAGDVGTDVLELNVPSAPPPPLPPRRWRAALRESPSAFVAGLRRGQRPGRGGLSAAHWQFPVGTITLGVRDRRQGGTQYALSCNHVFGRMGRAVPGDPILQPSLLDGGTRHDVLARFSRSVPLTFDGRTPEIADASLALCTAGVTAGTVAGIGLVGGLRDPTDVLAGEWVYKVGRTTGLTYGTVLATQATIRIDYSALGFAERVVFYHRQIVTTGMGAYGDSGSLLLDSHRRGLGMLFAGGHGNTVHNPLVAIASLLGVTITPQDPRLAPMP